MPCLLQLVREPVADCNAAMVQHVAHWIHDPLLQSSLCHPVHRRFGCKFHKSFESLKAKQMTSIITRFFNKILLLMSEEILLQCYMMILIRIMV